MVDDHPLLLEGIRKIVTDPFEVVASTSSGKEALELLKTQDFDVLVTDYEMPDLSGAELVKAARATQPEIKIIILSMHDDPSIVRELLRSGALGYVLKKDTHHSINMALQQVIAGKRYLSNEITELLIELPEEDKGVLTPREREIIRLIAKEYNSRQIAEILFISERTVETHRKNILRKTNVTNLVGLIKYAYANKLV